MSALITCKYKCFFIKTQQLILMQGVYGLWVGLAGACRGVSLIFNNGVIF